MIIGRNFLASSQKSVEWRKEWVILFIEEARSCKTLARHKGEKSLEIERKDPVLFLSIFVILVL